VENRLKWHRCDYRGPLILHTSNWPAGDLFARDARGKPSTDDDTFMDTLESMVLAWKRSGYAYDRPLTPADILARRGGVLGVCELVDVIAGPLEFQQALRQGRIGEDQVPWYMGGFALLLANVRPLPFVRCGGALGLFGLHPEAYRLVMAARTA
jgi:hypothetical protein